MNSLQPTDWKTSRSWWGARRLHYNIGLLIAGPAAFVCYLTILHAFEDVFPEIDVTIFTILLQCFAYGFFIVLANICYYLGPIAEAFVRPKRVVLFRKVTYRLGFCFSVALSFSVPLLSIITIVVSVYSAAHYGEIKQAMVVGEYVASHKEGLESLEIRPDGTYAYRYEGPNGKRLSGSGEWRFERQDGKPMITFRAPLS